MVGGVAMAAEYSGCGEISPHTQRWVKEAGKSGVEMASASGTQHAYSAVAHVEGMCGVCGEEGVLGKVQNRITMSKPL